MQGWTPVHCSVQYSVQCPTKRKNGIKVKKAWPTKKQNVIKVEAKVKKPTSKRERDAKASFVTRVAEFSRLQCPSVTLLVGFK